MNLFTRLASLFKSKPATNTPARAKVTPPAGDTFAETLARVAESQLGVRETGPNKGAALQPYFDADDYDPNGSKPGDDGYAWCAAFVCWCVMRAIALMGMIPPFIRPKTAAAFGFEKWARAMRGRGVEILPAGSAIKRGDIIVFAISHIGVAVRNSAAGAPVTTVDGNTNDDGAREGYEVAQRTRKRSAVRSVIRIG
jgi:hypothetical protein